MVGAGVIAETEAILRLKTCPGLGDRRISALVERHGSGVGALEAVRARGSDFDGGDWGPSLASWREAGIQVVPMTSPRYPGRLRDLHDPPPVVFMRGNTSLVEEPSVAVVGSRRATEGGRDLAESLGRVLGHAGVTLVSGMALGIDGAAHRGALGAGGNTVGVLGSGLDVVYPKAHRRLFRDVARHGLLLSEFLPSEPALPHHFPKRNRIIAALAHAVVVVEAGERSGALITVDHGLDLGREIMAFPGSARNPQARGSNALLRDGARVLLGPEDVLSELPDAMRVAVPARPGGGAAAEGAPGGGPSSGTPGPGASPALDALWGALAPVPRGLDAIAEGAGMTPAEALAGLSSLELLGRARRCPGMRFCRA
jgi:DNA processing protein